MPVIVWNIVIVEPDRSAVVQIIEFAESDLLIVV